MNRISEALAVPEVEGSVPSSVGPQQSRREGSTDSLARWSALEPWRTVLPAAFVALWIGFSLVPHAHQAFRVPSTVALAALIGIGAELCTRSSARTASGRMASGTLWIVPAGATMITMALLTALGPRLSHAIPLLAGVVAATLVFQGLEMSGLRGVENWSRSLNSGLAFALAFAVFVFTPPLPPAVVAFVYAAVAALVTLVVLRGSRASTWDLVAYVAITAGLIMQLGLMLDDSRSPIVAAGIPLLGLYAVSTTAQAVLDRAPWRAYVEVGLVTFGVLAIAIFNVSVSPR